MILTTNWGLMKPETGESDTAQDWATNLDAIDAALLTPTDKTDLTDGGDTSLHHHDTHNDARYSLLGHNHDADYAQLSHDHDAAEIVSGDLAYARIASLLGIGTSNVSQIKWAYEDYATGSGTMPGNSQWYWFDGFCNLGTISASVEAGDIIVAQGMIRATVNVSCGIAFADNGRPGDGRVVYSGGSTGPASGTSLRTYTNAFSTTSATVSMAYVSSITGTLNIYLGWYSSSTGTILAAGNTDLAERYTALSAFCIKG